MDIRVKKRSNNPKGRKDVLLRLQAISLWNKGKKLKEIGQAQDCHFQTSANRIRRVLNVPNRSPILQLRKS